MTTKSTYRFAQYRTDQIAKCVANLDSFDTTGNLSGRYQEDRRTNAVMYGHGWESQHPEWQERLRYYETQGRETHDVLYAVYSFGTVIGILVKHVHSGEWHWEIDKAANRHSPRTSRAVSSFFAAIDAPGHWDWNATQLGTVSTLHPQSVYRVYQIGEAWIAAQNLSPHQRRALTVDRGLPQRAATIAAMQRVGVIDDRGFMTDLGLRASRYCVGGAS